MITQRYTSIIPIGLILIFVTESSITTAAKPNVGCGKDRFEESDPKIIAQNFTGTVQSPNFPDSYPTNLQCTYTFVANPRRRVHLQFEEFILDGSAPQCGDYLDIYSELRDSNLDVINDQHSGRYCGTVSPRTRISLHRVIVLVFHVRNGSCSEKGFLINYSFIDEEKYLVHGLAERLLHDDCGFILNGKTGESYSIYSPTYPGKYPANTNCKYLLKGQPGTRIKLSLKDFDLFFGGQHCPYDALTIYDGVSNKEPVITRLCGLQQLVDIFSHGPDLYMEFFTVDPPFAEHRGFYIEATFGRTFVDLAHFTQGDRNIQHIAGTECDVRVISASESEHYIHSPNFPDPYPPNTTCTYYLDGLQGARSLEKVHLTIKNFSISSYIPDPLPVTTQNPNDCPYSNLTIDWSMRDDKSESGDNDIGLCGGWPPSPLSIESEGPRMTVTFNAADELRKITNIGFRAFVKFHTDFGIPGNHSGRSSDDCIFTYLSQGVQKMEFFNSPRYPDNYPLSINCTYHLIGRPGEIIRLNFEQFEMSRGSNKAANCYDNVTIYNVFSNGREKLLGAYCWDNYPGPIVSHDQAHKVKIIFNSDREASAAGFRASYEFVPNNPLPNDTQPEGCGEVIKGRVGGILQSPGFSLVPEAESKYKSNWICHWDITVKKNHNILLQPIHIKVEGGRDKVEGRSGEEKKNCRAAVIRIHDDLEKAPSQEWCGAKIFPEMKEYLSQGDAIRVSFLSAPEDKMNGMPGFQFSWTEVRTKRRGEINEPPCNGTSQFRCKYTRYCISKELYCNEAMNCGEGDDSDEDECPPEEPSRLLMTIAIGAGSGLLVIIVIITLCVISRKKRRRKTKEDRRSIIAQRMALNPTPSSIADDYNMYRHDLD